MPTTKPRRRVEHGDSPIATELNAHIGDHKIDVSVQPRAEVIRVGISSLWKSARSNLSAGILAYRRRQRRLEVLLVHPGGPFWGNKDDGAWSIPKGEIDVDEDPEKAALREFTIIWRTRP